MANSAIHAQRGTRIFFQLLNILNPSLNSCQVQYGGRVTDDFDKRLLITITHVWFTDALIAPAYKFYDGYPVPEVINPFPVCKNFFDVFFVGKEY